MTYRLFGAEMSPYSVKLRSYMRYKSIDHEWIVRDLASQGEFQKYAKLPLIPLLVTPEGEGMQDTTPIIAVLERENPEPSITPPGDVSPFVSALLEEYADEWGNKPMFHYRWFYPEDQRSASWRLAEMMLPLRWWARLPGIKQFLQKSIAKRICERMIPRLSFVGSSEKTKDRIEGSFINLCELVDKHLSGRDYLFGGRPSLADFGLSGQFYCLWTDPVPVRIIRGYSRLDGWVTRMLDPVATGDWEDWDVLAPTLSPILVSEVSTLYFPWSDANKKALEAGEKVFSVLLQGEEYSQETQKYHARSLGVLKQLYEEKKNSSLDELLEETGCLSWLRA